MNTNNTLSKYISPVGAWALAFGCCVGWGAFVMPGSTFLPTAGPVGSCIGMMLGALLMLVIAANYHYMMQRYGDAGGAYSFVKNTFGHDHAYLCSWFLVLTYVAILWANATAIVLIARNLIGDVFQTGLHYTVMGYDIYMGEALFTICAVAFSGLICIVSKNFSQVLEIVMALFLFFGIVACYFAVTGNVNTQEMIFAAPFAPDGAPAVQVIYIVALVPWAFVGFEAVSHSTEEFRFPVRYAFRIMAIACIACGLSYCLPAVIAASARPDGYADWTAYIADLGAQKGLAAMPVFYAVNRTLGSSGLLFLGLVVLCAVLTSLIGNYTVASRLIYAMSKDGIFPARFGTIGRRGTPEKAILLIMAVSVFIPFLGRTAIGWIVDVTTIGATITYGYTSASAYKCAKENGDERYKKTGITGIVLAILFGLFLLVPDVVTTGSLATESYLIFTVWGILGFVYFRIIFGRDTERRYGKSVVVWIALLLVLLFSSLMWMRKATAGVIAESVSDGETYERIYDALTGNSTIHMALIILSLAVLFSIYAVMRERENRLEIEKAKAEESSEAKSAFLSNMSHEIRTPINAVLGMNEMILRESESDRITEYARNIESAGKSLLSIINDILDFSKIEAGKMEIVEAPYKLSSLLNDLANMVSFRAQAKSLAFDVEVDESLPDELLGDEVRVRQVATNILTNAVKYTKEGSVKLIVEGERYGDDMITLVFRARDTGIGIKKEDLPHLFEKFERVDLVQTNTIEGTGLGLSITQNLTKLMNGHINVESVYGKGSTFSIFLPQKIVADEPIGDFHERYEQYIRTLKRYQEQFHAPAARILAVDDTDMNLTVLEGLLEKTEVQLDTVTSGADAIEMAREKEYDLILMDHRMPKMDGTEAMEHIRADAQGKNRETPVIVLTADAVAGAKEKYLSQGFTDYLSKPVDSTELENALRAYLPEEKMEAAEGGDDAVVRQAHQPLGSGVPELVEGPTAGDVEATPLQSFYKNNVTLHYTEALKSCGSEKVLTKSLLQFYKAIDDNAGEIETYLKEEDYRSYNVKVHALKSSARLIGASDLSAFAARMEETSNDLTVDNKKEIAERTPQLLADYRACRKILSAYFGTSEEGDTAEKPPVTPEKLNEIFASVREAAEDFDSDTVDELVGELETYTIPEEEQEHVTAIGKAARDMDWDALEELLGGSNE